MSNWVLSTIGDASTQAVDGQGHTDQGHVSPMSHARGWVVRMRTVRKQLTVEGTGNNI